MTTISTLTESFLLLAGGGAMTLFAQTLAGHRRDLFARVRRLEDRVDRQGTDIMVTRSMLESLQHHGLELTRGARP